MEDMDEIRELAREIFIRAVSEFTLKLATRGVPHEVVVELLVKATESLAEAVKTASLIPPERYKDFADILEDKPEKDNFKSKRSPYNKTNL